MAPILFSIHDVSDHSLALYHIGFTNLAILSRKGGSNNAFLNHLNRAHDPSVAGSVSCGDITVKESPSDLNLT